MNICLACLFKKTFLRLIMMCTVNNLRLIINHTYILHIGIHICMHIWMGCLSKHQRHSVFIGDLTINEEEYALQFPSKMGDSGFKSVIWITYCDTEVTSVIEETRLTIFTNLVTHEVKNLIRIANARRHKIRADTDSK